jgi:DNA-binding MarR family transcriptional regulator
MDPHQQKPGFQIRRLHQSAVAIFVREMGIAALDLTPVQYAVLSALAKAPGLDQAGLAAQVALDKATAGGVVDRLLTKNLITREINPANRRARILNLTKEGVTALEQSEPVVEAIQDKILAGLSETERADFLVLLQKAVAAIKDETRTAG